MAGNDDLIARLNGWAEAIRRFDIAAAHTLNEGTTALAERDATIERLEDALESVKQDAVDARSERDEARAETAKVAALAEDLMNDKLPGALETLSARAETAERDRDEARAEVERLKQDVKAARAETSAVAKVLAYEPPYQASLAKRVEGLVHWKEVNETEIARLNAEVERKDAALHLIESWEPATQEITVANTMAAEARAALTAKGGENAEG